MFRPITNHVSESVYGILLQPFNLEKVQLQASRCPPSVKLGSGPVLESRIPARQLVLMPSRTRMATCDRCQRQCTKCSMLLSLEGE